MYVMRTMLVMTTLEKRSAHICEQSAYLLQRAQSKQKGSGNLPPHGHLQVPDERHRKDQDSHISDDVGNDISQEKFSGVDAFPVKLPVPLE